MARGPENVRVGWMRRVAQEPENDCMGRLQRCVIDRRSGDVVGLLICQGLEDRRYRVAQEPDLRCVVEYR